MSDVTSETARPCRYCVAAYDSDAEMCGFAHEQPAEVLAPLALAMARMFQTRHPSDEQVGWFMEDASAVADFFDPLPDEWTLRKMRPGRSDEFTARFSVNGVTYVVENGEGHITPVPLDWLRASQRETESAYSG